MDKDLIVEQFVVADFDGVSVVPELPPEVWKLILDNIKDSPTTLVSCYNTCQSWRDLLEEKKSEFYFPLILPFLEKYLSNNELLDCRQVCTSWKGTMDEHRQSEVPPFDRYRFFGRGLIEAGGDVTLLRSPKLLGSNHFYEDSSPPEFFEAMKNHPGNPFPTRCVIVELGSAEAFSHFQRVLEEFGKEIRTLVFICRENYATSASNLQPIFNYCTNLTSLTLKMPGSWERHGVRNSLRWMTAHPTQLPEIPTLVSLNIYGYGSESVAEALLKKYGRQFQRLEVNQQVMKDYLTFMNLAECFADRGETPSSLLLNLTTLKVRQERSRPLEVLETLKYCKFPLLERLSLCENNNFEIRIQPVSFRLLIRAINPFSASLVQLFLPFHKAELDQVDQDQDSRQTLDQELAVQFPKLRMLGVSYSTLQTQSLQMLLSKKFVALEELIFYDYRRFPVRTSVLEGGAEQYCKSKWRHIMKKLEGFWKLLPSLKAISVNRRISHAQNMFRLKRPQSQVDLETQREAVVNVLWECDPFPLVRPI